jgi:hypothetical protein
MKKMKRLSGVICLTMFLLNMHAQKRWDGGGGGDQWANALNWTDDIVPGAGDTVLLDNSLIAAGYSVQLPAGNTGVIVTSLLIQPANGFSIQLMLPLTNTAIPGLNINGAGGFQIHHNGTFVNASGGSPGTAIAIADSLYIFNGGRFVQNASGGHAGFVARLSRRSGTENGTFEFNVPGPASYTISLAARTYGNIELRSTAAGGTKSYLSNGANNAVINGDCQLFSGVNYSLDFTGMITVNGSLINDGNFNIASAANNNTVRVRRNLTGAGNLTETSSGLPVLELNGNVNQDINLSGNINNSVAVRVNNPAGITLLAPLMLPYKLELAAGRITTSNVNLLTLASACTLQSDSTNNSAFINGPVRKVGLGPSSYFHFPVGKGTDKRWLSLREAAGDFNVEFIKASAYTLSGTMMAGIDHVSHIEYWSIVSAGGTAAPELSFDDMNSGGVTNLADLRVARLQGGGWNNGGNVAVSGSAGNAGSVTGETGSFDSSEFWTLASAVANQNPLPLASLRLWATARREGFDFHCWFTGDHRPQAVELEWSVDGKHFEEAGHRIDPGGGRLYVSPVPGNAAFARARAVPGAGDTIFSNRVALRKQGEGMKITGYDGYRNCLSITAAASGQITLYIFGGEGRLLRTSTVFVHAGNQQISLSSYGLSAGIYQVFALSSASRTNPLLFFKP